MLERVARDRKARAMARLTNARKDKIGSRDLVMQFLSFDHADLAGLHSAKALHRDGLRRRVDGRRQRESNLARDRQRDIVSSFRVSDDRAPRVEIDIALADLGKLSWPTAGQQRREMIALMNRVFDRVPCLAPRREVGEVEHGFRDLDLSKPYAGGRRGRRIERAIKPRLFAVAGPNEPCAMVGGCRDGLRELRMPRLHRSRVLRHLGERPSVPLRHDVRHGKLAGVSPPSRRLAFGFGLRLEMGEVVFESRAERHRLTLAGGSRASGDRARIDQGLLARLISGHRRPVAERLEYRRPLAFVPALLTEAPDGRLRAEEDGQAEDLAVGIVAPEARLIVGELAQRFDAIFVEQARFAFRVRIRMNRSFAVVRCPSAPRSLALGGLSGDALRRMFFGSVTRYPRLTIEINLAENLVDHRVISLCHRDVTMMPFD